MKVCTMKVWSARQVGDKWQCFSGDESYSFETREFASACAKLLNQFKPLVAVTSACVWKTPTCNTLRVGHLVVAEFEDGQLKNVNLSGIVGVWLRQTPLARALRALWFGELR